MLGWIFKKPIIKGLELPAAPARAPAGAAKSTSAKPASASRKGGAAAASATPAAPVEVVDWPARLQAAAGDDTALLALAESAAPLEIKLAAVEALSGEASLKLAERRLRNQERRVHRLAKQRLGDIVGRRETAAQAAMLLDSANALLAEEQVPVNRLVELDHAWQALNAQHLEPATQQQFATLLAQITDTTRERGELALRIKRWSADAKQVLGDLRTVAREAAAGVLPRGDMAAACEAAQATLAAAPESAAPLELRDALSQALQAAHALDERLALLDEVLALPADAPRSAPVQTPAVTTAAVEAAPEIAAEPTAEMLAVPDAAADAVPEAVPEAAPAEISALPLDAPARWQALPPLEDAGHAQALAQRFEAWQQSRQQAMAQARHERRTQQRAVAKEHQRAERTAQLDSLAGLLEKAEAALDGGHLAETHQHLLAIDELLHGGASDAALRARIDGVQARYAQLKGWQHWAGGLARDELTQQAEALAAVAGGPPEARTVKLSIKQQAEVIQDMRNRWKELDHLGGATSRALWQRFDTALKAAYEPVAAHLKVLQDQREKNLLTRRALVQSLGEAALPDADSNPGNDPARWRPVAEALEHHLTEWRKLGPVEHTVPRKAQPALLAQWEAAVQRLQGPLQQARQAAKVARQALVARARELAAQAAAGTAGRDTVAQVRELQSTWQQQAKALPLQRGAENALWAEFKGTIDSIFAARDAAFNARDAEFKAYAAERQTLIQRLEELAPDTPEAQLKRALTELQGQWQRCGPAPRAEAAALDERWQRALTAARGHLNQSSLQRWQTVCDALQAKRRLGAEWAASAGDADERQAHWASLPALPPAWEEALRQRAGLAPAAAQALASTAVDQNLLHLEAAWNLPSPPAHEDARRAMKLQAMKAAMESRRGPAPAPRTPEELWVDLLRQAALNKEQETRLDALLQAVRRRGQP